MPVESHSGNAGRDAMRTMQRRTHTHPKGCVCKSGIFEAQMQDISKKGLDRLDWARHIDTQRYGHRECENQQENERVKDKVAPFLFLDHTRKIDDCNTEKIGKDQNEIQARTSCIFFGFRRQAASSEIAGSSNSKNREKNGAVLAPQSMFSTTDSKTSSV